MEHFIDKKYKKLFHTIKTNISITCFNGALCGSIIWLMLGAYAIPIYASIIKISMCIGDLFRCKIQNNIAEHSIKELNKKYLFIQFIETIFSFLAYIFITININVGIFFMIISIFLESITRAYFLSYSIKIDDIMTNSNVIKRAKYNAELDRVATIFCILGNLINSIIYFFADKYCVNVIIIYKMLSILYAFIKIIDLICSFIEYKKIKEIILKGDSI